MRLITLALLMPVPLAVAYLAIILCQQGFSESGLGRMLPAQHERRR